MSTRHARGLWAETAAVCFLRLKNYRILERRSRTPLGEVDIIAQRGDTLVLVEVKYRQNMQSALECITPKQRDRLLRAANYVAPRYKPVTIRWDVIAFAPWSWPRHIVNAWEAI